MQAFADAGCRYLQLDEVNLAYLCDPEQRQILRERGDDPERLPGIYAEMINTAIGGRPPDMTITMHLCRGNFRSSWIAQGGYEPVAELLFNQIGVDGYFMEFDTERAGGFEPLRFVPKEQAGRAGTGHLQEPARWNRPTNWSGGSTMRQGTSIWSSSASARSAASPAPRKATPSPRRSSGPSWRASWKWRGQCGANEEGS